MARGLRNRRKEGGACKGTSASRYAAGGAPALQLFRCPNSPVVSRLIPLSVTNRGSTEGHRTPNMPTLATTVDGLKLPNPFIIGSGPPGTNLNVINKAFKEGWGAVIAKTVSLDASKVVNVTPRYAKLYSADRSEVIGWENIELISDRKFEIWLDEFKRCKDQFPDGVLIASIMEEFQQGRVGGNRRALRGGGRGCVRVELLLPARSARTQDGRGDGPEPRGVGRGLRLGHGRGEETRLGEDDAQHHAHRRPEPRGVARRLPGRERDQHDPQRHERQPRNAAPRADRRGLHDAGRVFVARRCGRLRCACAWRSPR